MIIILYIISIKLTHKWKLIPYNEQKFISLKPQYVLSSISNNLFLMFTGPLICSLQSTLKYMN